MTEERLAEIEARLKEASPGPWEARARDCDTPHDSMSDAVAGLGFDIMGPPEPYLRGQFERGTDAQLIANAPTDIADLLAEVRRLQAECATYKAMFSRSVVLEWRADEP